MSEEATMESTETVETTETTEAPGLGVESGQESSESWLSSLPEDLQTSASLAKFDSPASLAKSYLEAEKGISSRIKMPEKDDEAGMNELYDKLGRPESPDKYDLEGIEHAQLASDEANKGQIDRFKEVGHKYGLNNRQVAGIIDDVLGMNLEAQQQVGEAQQANISELKQEYGPQFDNRVELANQTLKNMVEKTGGNWNRLAEALTGSGMTSQPDLLKALAGVGRMMEQDKIWGAGGEPRSMGGLSPGEINAKIDSIKAEHIQDLVQETSVGIEKQKEIDKLMDLLLAAS